MTAGTVAGFSRYVRLDGAFVRRDKSGRSGSVPHYLAKGVDPVEFDSNGDPVNLMGTAIAIEARFTEVNPPIGLPRGKDALLIVQLVVGGGGHPAARAEAKMLDELGRLIDNLVAKKQKVSLIAAPYGTAEQYGMASGRFAPMAVFDEVGHALWLHPEAVASGLLKGTWPEAQKVRSIQPDPGNAAGSAQGSGGPLPDWYTRAMQHLAPMGLAGADLMVAACKGQGAWLFKNAVASSEAEGIEMAKTQIREALTALGLPIPSVLEAVVTPAPEAPKGAPKGGGAAKTPRQAPGKGARFGADADAARAAIAPGGRKRK